jgi:hypothetical protein
MQSASQTQAYESTVFMLSQDWRILANWRIAVQNGLGCGEVAMKMNLDGAEALT